MATAFDLANLSVLTLLSYARDMYGDSLTLRELADNIETDAEDFFANNEVEETDRMLTQHVAKALADSLRELAKNGYDVEDLTTSVTNLLPDEAIDEITNDVDGDDDEEEELEDEDDEDDDSEEEEDELDEDEDEEEDEDEDDEEDDLDEDEEDEEDEDADDEEEDLDEEDASY